MPSLEKYQLKKLLFKSLLMEKLLFRQFFLEAWHASISKKLPWLFGAIIGIVSILETQLTLDVPETTTPDELIAILAQKAPDEWLWILCSLALLLLFGIFGRSNLIPSLSFVAGKKNLSNYPDNRKALGMNFLRGLCLEGVMIVMILCSVIILSFPLWLASVHNPGAMIPLTFLALLTLVPISIILFFVRQYALLYLLLSPIGIRGAFEASAKLFSRSILQSFFFGLFAFLLTLLFTFFLNLAILSVSTLAAAISIPSEKTFPVIIISGLFFAWFALFQQALWIAFFRTIAGTENKEKVVTEKTAPFVENTKVPDVPPIQ